MQITKKILHAKDIWFKRDVCKVMKIKVINEDILP